MDDDAGVDDHWQVVNWRYEQALEAGLDAGEATIFADSDADLETLRQLVGRGCDPHLAARVVL